MKLFKTILFLLVLGPVLVLAARPAELNKTLTVTVTSESYEKARGWCAKVYKEAGGYIGQVALYDDVGRHYSIPCQPLLEGK